MKRAVRRKLLPVMALTTGALVLSVAGLVVSASHGTAATDVLLPTSTAPSTTAPPPSTAPPSSSPSPSPAPPSSAAPPATPSTKAAPTTSTARPSTTTSSDSTSTTTATTTTARSPTPAVPGAATPNDRIAGVDFGTAHRTLSQWDGAFRRIRADGANTVSFDVWWRVPSFWSDTLAADYSPNPANPRLGLTDPDTDLLTASQEARQAGLNVTLTPKFLVGPTPSFSGSTWRGDYRPAHPAAFFSQYQAMVDHYADLARQAGMSTFFVGSEMSDSIDFVDTWRQIVSSARQHFGGPVGYEVDWRQPAQFSWGDAVDVIALSAYFPLSNAPRPTLRQLDAGWHSYKYQGHSDDQDAFSSVAALAQRWGKPISFGDVGYRATAYPARAPSENARHPADPNEQYLAYRALLDTFAGQSWWGGVTWWAWNEGSQRSPASKPAERLISAQCVTGDAGAPADAQGTVGPSCPGGTIAAARTANGTARLPAELALGTFIVALLTMIGAGVLLRSGVRRAARARAVMSPTMPFPVTSEL